MLFFVVVDNQLVMLVYEKEVAIEVGVKVHYLRFGAFELDNSFLLQGFVDESRLGVENQKKITLLVCCPEGLSGSDEPNSLSIGKKELLIPSFEVVLEERPLLILHKQKVFFDHEDFDEFARMTEFPQFLEPLVQKEQNVAA